MRSLCVLLVAAALGAGAANARAAASYYVSLGDSLAAGAIATPDAVCRYTLVCTDAPDVHLNADGYRLVAGLLRQALGRL